jgi:predicted nucleic acid-binding protein
LIFLDASVLLAAEDSDDSNHTAAAALLQTGALSTLELAAYELTNVAEVRWRDPRACSRLRERASAIAELGVLVRVDRELAERTAALSREHGISAYDAAYVAGAEQIGAPLASCVERDLVSRGLAMLPRELLGSPPRESPCRW